MKLIVCPFCGSKDFDLRGLKTHLENGWCEVYEKTEVFQTLSSLMKKENEK